MGRFSTKRMHPVLTLLGVLIVLVLLGGVAGILSWSLVLLQYRGTISFPFDGDVQLYRSAEPRLKSADRLRKWASAKGIPKGREYAAFEAQLANARAGPVGVAHKFYIGKMDVRDVPDPVLKDVLPKPIPVPLGLGGQGVSGQAAPIPKIRSHFAITASSTIPDFAAALARLATDFVSDTLILTNLLEVMQDVGSEARMERARLSEEIVTKRMSAASSARQLAALERVREKYKSSWAGEPASSSVQIQVPGTSQGARHLPPLQQVIGLESLLAEETEQVRRLEERLAYAAALDDFVRDFQKNAGEPATAAGTLDNLIAKANDLRSQSAKSKYPLGVEAAADHLAYKLATVQSRFVDSLLSPTEPVVQTAGPGRGVLALAGCALGVLVWLGLIYIGILPLPTARYWTQ